MKEVVTKFVNHFFQLWLSLISFKYPSAILKGRLLYFTTALGQTLASYSLQQDFCSEPFQLLNSRLTLKFQTQAALGFIPKCRFG